MNATPSVPLMLRLTPAATGLELCMAADSNDHEIGCAQALLCLPDRRSIDRLTWLVRFGNEEWAAEPAVSSQSDAPTWRRSRCAERVRRAVRGRNIVI
jgi:hypothetical protein